METQPVAAPRGLIRLLLALATVLALAIAALPLQATPAASWPTNSNCQGSFGDSIAGFISHDDQRRAVERLARSSHIEVDLIGHSNLGREIWSVRAGHGDTVVLIQGGIHGLEQHGTKAVLNLMTTLANNSKRSHEIRGALTVVAIPDMNPDASAIPRRQNVMTWADIQALHPQLAGVPASPGAWYHSPFINGMDVNRDFHADLDYEPVAADLPGSSATFGFYLSPEARAVREVYRNLENEFGRVHVFVDLHNQGTCHTDLELPRLVTIDEPSPAAGSYGATGAAFGPAPTRGGAAGDVVLVNDGSANPTLGCNPLVGFPPGAIALVDRGTCPFVQKVGNAQAAGAIAVIVVQSTAGAPTVMGGTDPDITIPSVMVWRDDGDGIKAGLPATGKVAADPERDMFTSLSISGRFMTDPTAHGDWPNFDDDASRRANLAVLHGVQRGQSGRNSPHGTITLYPQPPRVNLPGTALGSFALRGSAVVLFETSQGTNQNQLGNAVKQVENGLTGILDALTDGWFHDLDPDLYDEIPERA